MLFRAYQASPGIADFSWYDAEDVQLATLIDNTLKVGPASQGAWPTNAVYAAWYHASVDSAGAYALLQESTGNTFLNAGNGEAIWFRNNNVTVSYLDAVKFEHYVSSVQYGDTRTSYGPNSTWGAYLRVGGNGWGGTGAASVVATSGNLHLDAASAGYNTYLNWYAGGEVFFGVGNGANYHAIKHDDGRFEINPATGGRVNGYEGAAEMTASTAYSLFALSTTGLYRVSIHGIGSNSSGGECIVWSTGSALYLTNVSTAGGSWSTSGTTIRFTPITTQIHAYSAIRIY